MATSPTKTVAVVAWNRAILFALFLLCISTFTYTVIVTRQLAASVASLKTQMEGSEMQLRQMFERRIFVLQKRCDQQRLQEVTRVQTMLKQRKIRSISDSTQIWKMMDRLTAKTNNTVILPILLGSAAGNPGPKGPPGRRGPRGKAGPIGQKGMKGDDGKTGPKGAKGDQGKFGKKGQKGERGIKGSKGDSIAVPKIVLPPGDLTVVKNRAATFVCKAVGHPTPTIELVRKRKPMDARYKKPGEGMLEIVNVQEEDEGEIECIAKSVLGEDRKTARLKVLVKAKAEIAEENIEGEEGHNLEIKCNVEGIPLPKVRWFRLAAKFPKRVSYKNDKHTLVINQVKHGDGGKYGCNAENYLMNSSDVVSVQIKKRLTFLVKSPEVKNSIQPQNVSIYCFYENGVHPIRITWFKDDRKLPSKALLAKKNQVLQIPDIGAGDAGSYKCIIQSKFSTLQSVTKIMVSIPKTCKDIRREGRTKSDKYIIYPSDTRPVTVYCDMVSKGGIGVTVISHNSETRTLVDGIENAGAYKRSIKYSIPFKLINAVIAASTSCEQYIKYECLASALNHGQTPYGWWVSSSGRKMLNWGGVDHTKQGCSCSLSGSCPKTKCNCDANDGVWRKDEGLLNEKEYLPISEVRFGDTGHSSEKGYHTIGKLKCF